MCGAVVEFTSEVVFSCIKLIIAILHNLKWTEIIIFSRLQVCNTLYLGLCAFVFIVFHKNCCLYTFIQF